MGSGKSSGLTPLQNEMSRLLEKQTQALKKCCPHCWGSLERENIITLRCPACQKPYGVEELLTGVITEKI